MAEETNNLIDQVEETTSAETTEETKEQSFDPLGFMGETVKEEIKGNYDEDKAEKLDESEAVSENVEEESDEEGFAWGDIETETQEEEAVAEEPDEDWDEVLAEPAVAEETNLENLPAFELVKEREAKTGEAAKRIERQLGEAPPIDLEGREAILGEPPKGDASQIGGIPTMAAAEMQAVTGNERTVAAEGMAKVVVDLPEKIKEFIEFQTKSEKSGAYR